ncbi:hypothetical protein MTO96_035428, partial [Rhipicephalus appendiculatus]
MRRKDGSRIGCIGGHGSCTYRLCNTAADTDRRMKSFWNGQCPVPATNIEKSMRARLSFLIQLAIGWVPTTLAVEFRVTNGGNTTPEIKECSEEQYFRVSNITITDATISHIMTASFTLTLTKPLGNKPKMKLTLRKKSGIKIPCLFGYGSCTYKLCGGRTEQEQALASMWSNRCPIPTFEETPVLQFPMLPAIQMIAGIAPTRITIGFKVINGEQKFRLSDVTVEDATIGRTMTVNFTLTVTEELADEPKLEVTVIKQNGRKVSCPPRGGACVYRLCGGTSNEEKFLGQLWNNECPVPATERRESTSARLNPMIQMVIG